MKRPQAMRERVLMRVHKMTDALRIDVSCYHAEERDIMVALDEPQRQELVIAVTNIVMSLLGHDNEVQDTRFDRTRRVYNEKIGKRKETAHG